MQVAAALILPCCSPSFFAAVFCRSYQISGAAMQPWITGINYYAASGQYAGSRVCGLCLAFRGTRIGGSIPLSTQYALSEFILVACTKAQVQMLWCSAFVQNIQCTICHVALRRRVAARPSMAHTK